VLTATLCPLIASFIQEFSNLDRAGMTPENQLIQLAYGNSNFRAKATGAKCPKYLKLFIFFK